MSHPKPIFEAIQLESVRRSDLQEALRARGLAWEDASHVTATSSLAGAFWRAEDLAVSIAVLIDLIIVGGRAGDGPGSLEKFPAANDFRNLPAYQEKLELWSNAVDGARMRRSMKIDDELRQFARKRTVDKAEATLLVRERREFQRAMQTLVAAGLSPDSEEFNPLTALAKTARDAWRTIETAFNEVGHVRQDLWENHNEPEVIARCHATLGRAFGPRERWTIIHHGFYFYTPPQWALFRMLREGGLVNQYFIVHDDGALPMFEIWRRFFSSRWMMPEPKRPVGAAVHSVTPQASAFRAAWRGERIEAARLENALKIIEYRSPAEFVRSTLHDGIVQTGAGKHPPRLFAAQQEAIARYCDRLGPLAEGGRSVLAQLPVGAFLLQLHECIQGSDSGAVQLVLTADAVRDIATSGFLTLSKGMSSIASLRAALARAMPFFRDCRFASEWDERATSLERTVVDTVSRLGGREISDSDVKRLKTAIDNPMRLAPWADLSKSEVEAIRLSIHAITHLLKELAKTERIRFKEHADFITSHIKRGVEALSQEEQKRIASQLDGFSIGLTGDIDVTGLVDVVKILLGRSTDPDDGDSSTNRQAHQGAIQPLRALDSLGFVASSRPIHLGNLADGAFPSAVPAIGWPFRREDIADPFHIGRGLLETRSEHAALGDLYLIWLALDGVEPNVPVTLSWISEIAGDPRNLSAVLGMLRKPTERSLDAVAEKIGGLEIASPLSAGGAPERFRSPIVPPSIATHQELVAALAKVPKAVAAMALACPRWLANNWLFGPTAAHSADFQHFRLYGNLLGALQKGHGIDQPIAKEWVDGLWRFLSSGERASSIARSVVKANNGARSQWILTLEGRKDGRSPIALAYQSAAGYTSPIALKVLGDTAAGFQPPPTNGKRGDICKFCPAQSRCLAFRTPRDEND